MRIWRLRRCPEEEKSEFSKINLVGWVTQKKPEERRRAGKAPEVSCSATWLLNFGCSLCQHKLLACLSLLFFFTLGNNSYSQPNTTSTCKCSCHQQDKLAEIAYRYAKDCMTKLQSKYSLTQLIRHRSSAGISRV